ncbi:MAG: hypothetical protein HC853_04655 [Anaerolineae bacterium]|nr:hypothetical protein [Anaerolineae bacterium]
MSITYLNENEPAIEHVDALIFVAGIVFEDTNGNGIRELDEPALKGISIGVQMANQSQTAVPAVTVTDDKGAFALQAPEAAVLTVMSPEGWRVVGASSRFADSDMAFGLRPDRVVVQPILPVPSVTVQSALDPKTALLAAGSFALSVLLIGGLLAMAVRRHTRSMVEIADWHASLSLSVPGFAPQVATSKALSPMGLLNTSVDVSSLNGSGREVAVLGTNSSTSDCASEAHWFRIAEQAVADTLRESAQIESFLGLSPLPNAWIRFSTRDGQILTFGVSRFNLSSQRLRLGRAINPLISGRAYAEMRMLYQHFAALSDLPTMLPRQCHWYVHVEQAVLILPISKVLNI